MIQFTTFCLLIQPSESVQKKLSNCEVAFTKSLLPIIDKTIKTGYLSRNVLP